MATSPKANLPIIYEENEVDSCDLSVDLSNINQTSFTSQTSAYSNARLNGNNFSTSKCYRTPGKYDNYGPKMSKFFIETCDKKNAELIDQQSQPLPSYNGCQIMTIIALILLLSLHQIHMSKNNSSLFFEDNESETDAFVEKASHQRVFKTKQGIVFNSDFDSGNLIYVKYGELKHYYLGVGYDYNLSMNPKNHEKKNFNTENKQLDWFYFSVSNVTDPGLYSFSIVNLKYSTSMWKNGAVPVYRIVNNYETSEEKENLGKMGLDSQENSEYLGVSDSQTKKNTYYEKHWKKIQTPLKLELFKDETLKLTFMHYFTSPKETVYFALSYPWSYEENIEYFDNLEQKVSKQNQDLLYFHRQTLTKSKQGRKVEVFTISSQYGIDKKKFLSFDTKNLFPDVTQKPSNLFPDKKVLLFLSRIHPGDTPGNWVIKGILDHLLDETNLKENKFVKSFQDKFVLIIIPMINPDGVAQGFTKLDISNKNQHHAYKDTPLKEYPTIYAVKKLISFIHRKLDFFGIFDLHATLSKRGISFIGDKLDKNNYIDKLQQPYMFSYHIKENILDNNGYLSDKNVPTLRKMLSEMYEIDNVYIIGINFWGNKIHFSYLKKKNLIYKTKLNNKVRIIRDTSTYYTNNFFKSIGVNLIKAISDSYDLKYKKSDKLKNLRFAIKKNLKEYFSKKEAIDFFNVNNSKQKRNINKKSIFISQDDKNYRSSDVKQNSEDSGVKNPQKILDNKKPERNIEKLKNMINQTDTRSDVSDKIYSSLDELIKKMSAADNLVMDEEPTKKWLEINETDETQTTEKEEKNLNNNIREYIESQDEETSSPL